jgi:pimeloyl-ACP methyl ester carboxylesterase
MPDSSPKGAVLVIHGFMGFKDWGFFPYLANALAAGGLLSLRVNLGGCGIREEGEVFDEPEGIEGATLSQDLEDAAAAAAYLQSRAGAIPLGLFGHSRGGATAIVLASLHPDVFALVTWGAIAHADRFGPEADAAWDRGDAWPVTNQRTGQVFRITRDFRDDLERNRERFTIRARASEISLPWLIVHGAADASVPASEAEELHQAAGAASRLLLVPGAGHTFGAVHPFAGETLDLLRATDETVAWFVSGLA